MADFTLRQIRLIQILDKAELPLSGKQLSEQLSVSLRTVQNEVKAVNQGPLGKIILSGNYGYSLDRAAYGLHGDGHGSDCPSKASDPRSHLHPL